ncbi:hypothetical protein C0Z01_20220 [Photobacterium kishitanii]|uniref:hypothetical protein n=1 Tax=Photobacterium kishitanii TaxID=318456 RepID=UPI0007EF09A5|nr:hypothetical protein [Photobacterium kishitanii]OBU24624.1 hypothetical protein AYY22_21325 [Photobacterium kishitanii]PSW66548.1 hypothetical protein C0Z01_20220 [Photobacterium kishitanii]
MKYKIMLFLIISLLFGCSKYTVPKESDIDNFSKFLSNNGTESTSYNITINSLYSPNSPLFSPVLNIQRRKLLDAEIQLEPLVANGDPEAMFWLAKIIYRSSINDTPKALALLKESAKTYPYAAMALAPDNKECKKYFGEQCQEKWIEQAKKLFEKEASQGDVRAVFYSNKLKKDHDIYIDAIIEAANNNYYYPLVDYANNILFSSKINRRMETIALQLLNYASSKNFVPALESLIHYKEKKYNIDYRKLSKYPDYIILVNKGIKLGSNYAWEINTLRYRVDESKSNIDKYIVAKAQSIFNGDDIGLSFIEKISNNKKLSLANKKAQEMVNTVEDVIYIDGTHPRQN